MSKETITKGSGNIYQDLGFENPEEWQAKARLASEILKNIQSHGWDGAEASSRLGVSEDEVSNIQQGQFDRFTIDWLTRRLMKLERNITITVEPRMDHQPGSLIVQCA